MKEPRVVYCDIAVNIYDGKQAIITIHLSYIKRKLDNPITFVATLRDHIQLVCDNMLDRLIVRRLNIIFYDADMEIDISEEQIDEYIDVIVYKCLFDDLVLDYVDDAVDELHFHMDE